MGGFAVLGEGQAPLFEALASLVVDADLLKHLSPPLAAELAWAFGAAGIHHRGLFQQLEKLVVANINGLETEDVAGFAWAFSVLGLPSDSDAMVAISAYTSRFAGRLRPGERQMLDWALNRRESDRNLGRQ